MTQKNQSGVSFTYKGFLSELNFEQILKDVNYGNDVGKAFQEENTGNFAEGATEVLYVDSKWIDLASRTQMKSVKIWVPHWKGS